MTAPELFARLTDELPDVDPVVPVVFLDDELLPAAMAPVEPVAFVLECILVAWGPRGPQN
jgi:hypothetical protein